MQIFSQQRVFAVFGSIFSSKMDAYNFIQKSNLRIKSINLKQLQIIEDNNCLFIQVENQKYPFFNSAFKQFCGKLAIPAAYLNKLVSRDLVLKNIMESPNRFDEEIYVYIRQFEDQDYIVAVSENDPFRFEDFFEMLDKTKTLDENQLEIIDITVNPDQITLYCLRSQSSVLERYKFQEGVAISVGEGSAYGFQIQPFFRIHLHDGDSFDYLNKHIVKKLSRKEKSFKISVNDALYQFNMEQDNFSYPVLLKLLESITKTDEIPFSFLKSIRASVNRTFAAPDGYLDKIQLNNTIKELVPDYDFVKKDKEVFFKESPQFECQNIMIPYYLPKFFSQFEACPLTLQNDTFFNRQRQNVAKLIEKNAERYFQGTVHA